MKNKKICRKELFEKTKKLFFKMNWLCSEEGEGYFNNPFKKFKNEFCQYNNKNLILLSSVMIFVYCCALVGEFSGIITINRGNFVNSIVLIKVIQFAILMLGILVERKKDSTSNKQILIYLEIFVVYFFFIYVNITSIEYPAIALIVFIVGLQLFFIIPPIINFMINTIAVVVYIVLCYYLKHDAYFYVNMLNAISALCIGSVVSWSFANARIKQFRLLKENEVLTKKLIKLSNTDSLTSICNRRRFNTQFEYIFEKCKREETDFAFIMLDIDKFKAFNDNYGHLMGDQCLHKIGMLFRSFINDDISVYRYGGEEFAFIITGRPFEECEEFANMIIDEINNLDIKHEFANDFDHITVSIGISFKDAEDDIGQLQIINNADKGLYESKAKGGAAVTFIKEEPVKNLF
ncbi:MAG: GGDEF domain-containing protein [Clostridia bacterium]